MRKRVVIFLLLIIIGLSAFWVWRSQHRPPAQPMLGRTAKLEPRTKTVCLYFMDKEANKLIPEEREILRSNLEGELETTLRELAAGPKNANLSSPLPPYEICFRKIWTEGDCAFVDLYKEMQFNRLRRNYFEGNMEELGVYSIVNTLTKSFPHIKEVQILIEGKPADTLTGHMDLTKPLQFNVSIVKSP